MEFVQTHLVPFLFSLVAYPILLPAVLLLILINEIVRLVISLILKYQYGGKITLVREGADAFWGHNKEGNSRNVITYTVFNVGEFNEAAIIDTTVRRIMGHKDSHGKRPYDKLKKILVNKYGYACWKETDHFDIKDHIRILDENKVHSIDDIKAWLPELSKDMNDSKPQWQYVFFPKFNDHDGVVRSLLLLSFQHAYMDGVSFMMMMKNHISTTGFNEYLNPLDFKTSFWNKFLYHLNFVLTGPYCGAAMLYKKMFWSYWAVPSGKKRLHGQRNYTWTGPMDIEIIKAIRNKGLKQTRFTHVVSTAFATTLAKVLPKHKVLPEIQVGELAAMLPYPNPNPQNRFTIFNYPVRTEEKDFVENLKMTTVNSNKSMFGPEMLVFFTTLTILGNFPTAIVKLLLDGTNHSVLYSSVPGSRTQFKGANNIDVVQYGAWTPQPHDVGLVILSLTYNGKISFCGNADTAWLSKEELEDVFNEFPNTLKRLAIGERLSNRYA